MISGWNDFERKGPGVALPSSSSSCSKEQACHGTWALDVFGPQMLETPSSTLLQSILLVCLPYRSDQYIPVHLYLLVPRMPSCLQEMCGPINES